jgi:hypothetical protein
MEKVTDTLPVKPKTPRSEENDDGEEDNALM